MKFKINGLLTIDNVLAHIGPLNIFKAYSKHFIRPGLKFRAEFREDPLPSAVIDYYNGTYLYKDFGEDGAMNCFQFVGRKYGLNFKEVLIKLNEDFSLGFAQTDFSSSNYRPKKVNSYNKGFSSNTIIKVKKRSFNDDDLEWWGRQSWLKEMLIAAKISPIDYFRLTIERKNILAKLYKCEDYSYTMDYYENKGIFRRKLYFPKKESHMKWLSNVDSSIIQGWSLLPKTGNIGFIQSSFKDTGPTWRVYGCPVGIASNTEAAFIPEEVWFKIKPRYKHWVIFLDNDTTGIKKAQKFSQIYKIPYIHLPIGGPKDPADFWKLEGGREFSYQLKRQLSLIKLI